MLPKDHPIMVVQQTLQNTFATDSASSKGKFMVNIVWGVKGLDRSSVGLWDPAELGELIWNDEFDISPAENQQALLDLCDELTDDHPLVKDKDVKCWIKDMDLYVRADSNNQKSIPLEDEIEFNMYLQKFAFQTEKGQGYVRDYSLGFDQVSKKLITTRIMALTYGNIRDSRSVK